MFEPTNIAAEIIALTALANSTLGPGLQRLKTSDFKHVSVAGADTYPANGNPSTISGPIVGAGSIFLLTHISLYTAVEPAVDGTLSIFYGIGYDAITVRVSYNIGGNSIQVKATCLGVQGIINRPVLFVFPPQCTPLLHLVPLADPRTAGTIGLYGNLHGYFLPAGYTSVFQQFETNLKTEGT